MKQICALLLALLILGTLSACSAEKQNGQILDSGWVMRGDEDNFGYGEKWYKGFTKANDKNAKVNWYANTFTSSLVAGDRVLLFASDLGVNSAMWLMEHEQPEALLTVEEMAQTLGISRSQLFRIFCQTGGSLPKETLTRHRCEQALQLISQTDLSLEQIAYSCCFASAQHLRDTFRREGFAPPSSYRRDK